MIGIPAGGGYVSRYRLSAETLAAVCGAGGGSGERAVAGHDEDSLTMAGEAALNALHGRDVRRVGACFLASTTPPYLGRPPLSDDALSSADAAGQHAPLA